MTDGDTVAQLAVVVLLLGLAVPGLATAYDYAGTPIEYSESATVDYGNDTEVTENATVEGYGADPVVTVDGTELVQGTDYLWDADTGTIDWQNTTNTSDSDSAVVEYRAHQRTAETEMAWTIISPFFALFGMFALVSSVRTLWSYVAEVFD